VLAPFVLPAFAFAAVAADPAGPRLLNVQELVTPDDYPRTSLVNEEQGSVTVKVKVDKNGVVTSCKVTKSSGHVALDEQTCALFRARARFDPATDRKGRARAGDFTQQITWKLADSEPITVMPRQAWMVRSTIGLTGRGAFVNCTMETSGIAEEPKDCELMKAVAKAQAVAQASPADIAGFAITEVYSIPSIRQRRRRLPAYRVRILRLARSPGSSSKAMGGSANAKACTIRGRPLRKRTPAPCCGITRSNPQPTARRRARRSSFRPMRGSS